MCGKCSPRTEPEKQSRRDDLVIHRGGNLVINNMSMKKRLNFTLSNGQYKIKPNGQYEKWYEIKYTQCWYMYRKTRYPTLTCWASYNDMAKPIKT